MIPVSYPGLSPIVESMAALVVVDAVIAQQARRIARNLLPPVKREN